MSKPLLQVERLQVVLASGAALVEDVSLSLERGSILGLVGESGSGKTTTALALLGFVRPGAQVVGGSIKVEGIELVGRPENDLRQLRGKLVSYVPQDPGAALNPSLRIGDQIAEMLRSHQPKRDPREAIAPALERVALPSDRSFQRRYQHELSGGQQQRVAIAVALVCEPSLVVMDEPTTGLDVITQAHILKEVDRLRRELGLAIVYVSHDLAVVGSIADRIAVMYAGLIVEEGPAEQIFQQPKHPYTHGLVSSIPDHAVPRRLRGIPGVAVGVGERPPGCHFAPRCPQRVAMCEQTMPSLGMVAPGRTVRCFQWQQTPPLAIEFALEAKEPSQLAMPLLAVESLRAEYQGRRGAVVAAREISFAVSAREAVALVGESGSGKTTVARCIAGLHPAAAGQILLDGVPLAARAGQRSREERRRVQIVFQSPYDSLNPRHRIGDAITRPARFLLGLRRTEADAKASELLERVRLPARLAERYPRELSGGERQRVAIARALSAGPDLLICDEITSALDVSVQAAVLELLAELRAELGLALLFISHDLGVVASVSDRVLVLQNGVVREQGPVATVLTSPTDDYTRLLIEAAPRLAEASAR